MLFGRRRCKSVLAHGEVQVECVVHHISEGWQGMRIMDTHRNKGSVMHVWCVCVGGTNRGIARYKQHTLSDTMQWRAV